MSQLDLTELARRLENLIRNGTIAEADYPAARVRVKYAEDENGNDVLTTWLPWSTARAGNDSDWWAPEVGEQVTILSPSGDMALGVVLPSIYQTAHPAPANDPNKRRIVMSDGAVIEYDRATHHLKAELPEGATTELVSTGGITAYGDLMVYGNITASQEISDHTRSMQGDRDIYNNHDHAGVTTGSGTTAKTDEVQ